MIPPLTQQDSRNGRGNRLAPQSVELVVTDDRESLGRHRSLFLRGENFYASITSLHRALTRIGQPARLRRGARYGEASRRKDRVRHDPKCKSSLSLRASGARRGQGRIERPSRGNARRGGRVAAEYGIRFLRDPE